MIPSNCTVNSTSTTTTASISASNSTSSSNILYFMRATCRSDDVNVFQLNKFYLKKEVIALIIVFADLAVGFVLFIMFIYLRAI